MPAVLKCPCHGIILDGTPGTCCIHQNYKKHTPKHKINTITGNYGEGKNDLDGRKYNDIILVLIYLYMKALDITLSISD